MVIAACPSQTRNSQKGVLNRGHRGEPYQILFPTSLMVTVEQQEQDPLDYSAKVLAARGELPPLHLLRSPPAVEPAWQTNAKHVLASLRL